MPASEFSHLTPPIENTKTELNVKFNACLDLFSAQQQHIDFVCSRLLYKYHCVCNLRGLSWLRFFRLVYIIHSPHDLVLVRFTVLRHDNILRTLFCVYVPPLAPSPSLVWTILHRIKPFSPFEMQLAYPK